MKPKLTQLLNNKNLHRLAIAIILLGVVLRFIFYFQNRCLFIDEANVARNIYERSFKGLTTPLNYEQYAPPVFLWIIKCLTLTLGYSEYSFRMYSFICGLAALWLMYSVLKKYSGYTGIWYPLFIMATGFIYIRYSADVKQYMPDCALLLLLMLIALKVDILKIKSLGFFVLWSVVGSVSIWLSMTSVFMLAGIGAYYFYIIIKQRNYKKLLSLAGIACIWLLQFIVYYLVILKPQIKSDYLQNGHKDFFLFFIPDNYLKLAQNADALLTLFTIMGGKWTISVVFHLLTLFTGIGYLLSRKTAKSLLLIVPLLALFFIVAGMHQYALSWAPEDEIARQCAAIQKYHAEVAKNMVTGGRVFIYDK